LIITKCCDVDLANYLCFFLKECSLSTHSFIFFENLASSFLGFNSLKNELISIPGLAE